MKTNATLLFLLSFMLFLSSCELIFGPPQRNKITKYSRPEYTAGSIFVYLSTNNTMIDSFLVDNITMGYNDEDDHEEIFIYLKSLDSTFYRTFNIFLYPDWIGVTYNHYHYIGFSAYEPTQIFEINGINYDKVYIIEQKTDTLIDKILFQGKKGILGYRFADGDEYYLDTIINPE
jgi:hypothetical protein